MNTGDFLKELYGNKPGNHHILIWKKGHSEWFTKIEEAAAYVKKNPDDQYFGVGTSEKNFGSGKRCPVSKISGIPGFWADIDIHAEGAHKGKNYPKDMAEAMSLVKVPEMEPSLIIFSGYGMHCYWIFDNFMSFDNNAERKQGADLEHRMNVTIQNRAAKHGWIVDSVFDLARILRPVGSNNCKQSKKKLVKVIENTGKRYDPLDLDSMLDKLPDKNKRIDVPACQPQLLDPGVSVDLEVIVPMNKIMLLHDTYEEFGATWSNDRSSKWSASEYDMSLASMAAGIGWSDQEIIDLIVHNRRENNMMDVKKMCRRDYFDGTLRKAKENARDEEFEKLANKISKNGGGNKQGVMDSINSIIKPLKFVRLDLRVDTPNYDYFISLELPNGNVKRFKLKKGLQVKTSFIEDVQNNTFIRLKMTTKQWDTLSQAFSSIVITHMESDIKHQVQDGIEGYLEKYENNKGMKMSELWMTNKPFKKNGHWFVYVSHFFSWYQISNHEGDKSRRTFKNELLDCGFNEITKSYSEHQPDGTVKIRRKKMLQVPGGYNIP